MEKLFILICIIFLTVIIYLIYRLVCFFMLAGKNFGVKENERGAINAYLLPLFFLAGLTFFIWYTLSDSRIYFRNASTIHGIWIDKMFWVTLLITGFVFLLTQFMLFYFPFHYKYKKGSSASYYPNNYTLEIIWTVIPLITLIGIFYFSSIFWGKITSPAPSEAIEIEIMAEQYNWRVRYPGQDKKFGKHNFGLISEENDFGIDINDSASKDDFAAIQLHIPKGQSVLFRIRSRDVVHSVYIPQFRLKMDAVPGMPTGFHFTPLYTTQEMRDKLANPNFNYEMACAELCGRSHFTMLLIVVVDEEEDFKKWYQQQIPIIAEMKMANNQD